jgi:putative DNA primase/helicase
MHSFLGPSDPKFAHSIPRRPFLTSRLVEYDFYRLRDVSQHHAVTFLKFNKGEKEWLRTNAPYDLITQLLKAEQWTFSTLKGIINTPTMKPDGSLLTEPGYDEVTELWFKPSSKITLPPIPERPTKEEAKAALATLNELLIGFPFDGETKDNHKSVSRSVALAGILTVVLRGAFGPAPIYAVTAPQGRTGKTHLVHLIIVFGIGHIPVPTAGSGNPEEMGKRIETAAHSGRPYMHFNNLPNGMVLESDALCQISTEGGFVFRTLGKHDEGFCDCRAMTVFVNGNNISVGGDLVTRTLICRLDANMEKPWERKFGFDPIELVRRDRGKYLAAIFTMARAFKAAGYPKPEPGKMNAVSGFEDWSKMVQQLLIWLGMEDPFGAMEEALAVDPAREKLQRLLDILGKYRKDLGEQFNAANCEKLAEDQKTGPDQRPAYKRPDLRDLMINRGRVDTTYFGRLLSEHQGKWYNKFRYVRGPTRGGRATYKFEDGEAPQPKAPQPDQPSPTGEDPEAL